MSKLNVVLRTCDYHSLQSNRIFSKNECITRCLNSLVVSLNSAIELNYTLHIIDDRSSFETITKIKSIASNASFDFLGNRDDSHLNSKQKSRYSLSKSLEYIYKLPQNELVYMVEDDYLHYPDSIEKMINAYSYFYNHLNKDIGIFPQDFPELYHHPRNPHNGTYHSLCEVFPGPDRYYRTTWFTHESFLLPAYVFTKFKNYFDLLLTIGNEPNIWEGSTISKVWTHPDVKMLMPMKTFAIHISKLSDIPFYNDDLENLWEQNKII